MFPCVVTLCYSARPLLGKILSTTEQSTTMMCMQFAIWKTYQLGFHDTLSVFSEVNSCILFSQHAISKPDCAVKPKQNSFHQMNPNLVFPVWCWKVLEDRIFVINKNYETTFFEAEVLQEKSVICNNSRFALILCIMEIF